MLRERLDVFVERKSTLPSGRSPTPVESPPSRATPIPAIPFPSRKTGKMCEVHRKTLAFRPPLETSFGAWEGWADGEGSAPGLARGHGGVELGAGWRADGGSRAAGRREEDRGLAGSAGSGSRVSCLPGGWGRRRGRCRLRRWAEGCE